MRGIAIVVAIALSVPLVGSLFPAPPAHAATPLLPKDFGDADLLRLLAAKEGYHPTAQALRTLPPGVTLDGMVAKLGARAGLDVRASDLAPFAKLDPSVAGPTTLLLVAVDQAWTMRDQAFAKLSPAEQQELLARLRAHDDGPRTVALAAQVDEPTLIDAAILLDDTLEGVVMPQLQQAAQSGAWPPAGAWDPIGVLRLGSTGNDVERTNRIVQIDPSGDDTYDNNAGGTATLSSNPGSPLIAVAVSVDLGGNDTYSDYASGDAPQGGGGLGIGLLLDAAGNDSYQCSQHCQGGGAFGVGLLHDYGGDDSYLSSQGSTGSGDGGIGVLRDDRGNDSYRAGGLAGGYSGFYGSVGLLWDRSGADTYAPIGSNGQLWGWAQGDNLGMFVDEGHDVDTYVTRGSWPDHGCNDCTWTIVDPELGGGQLTHRQTGNDGEGGLAAMLAANGP